MSAAPKLFLSHATEDKERFVLGFATKLRENGIDAWLDRWEVKPGQSLIQRIFEDGIGSASAFVVVLSKVSVTKPWVIEELDAGMVKKIENACKLIPVVLDDCQVPVCLRHLLWVKISDLQAYDAELRQIVNSVFGLSDKPALGIPPKHVTCSIIQHLPDLTSADNLVFSALCNAQMGHAGGMFDLGEIYKELGEVGMSPAEVQESLQILEGRHIIEGKSAFRAGIIMARVVPSSFDRYVRQHVENYEEMFRAIISKIVNEIAKLRRRLLRAQATSWCM